MWPLEKRLMFFQAGNWMTVPPPPLPALFLLLSCQRSQRKHPSFTKRQGQHECERRRAEAPAAASGHQRAGETSTRRRFVRADAQMPTAALRPPADHVSRVSRPAEEHDLHVRPRHLPAVRGPNERVSHLPQSHRAQNPPVLDASSPPPPPFLSLGNRSRRDTTARAAAARPSWCRPVSQPRASSGVLRNTTMLFFCSDGFSVTGRGKRCTDSHQRGRAAPTKTLWSPPLPPLIALPLAVVFTVFIRRVRLPRDKCYSPVYSLRASQRICGEVTQSSARYFSLWNSRPSVAVGRQAAANFHRLSESRARTRRFSGEPDLDLAVSNASLWPKRLHKSKVYCFVSVFRSALVTRCVLTVFAVEVLHKLGWRLVSAQSREAQMRSLFKKEKKRGLCKCQLGHHTRKLFSKNNVATASASLLPISGQTQTCGASVHKKISIKCKQLRRKLIFGCTDLLVFIGFLFSPNYRAFDTNDTFVSKNLSY